MRRNSGSNRNPSAWIRPTRMSPPHPGSRTPSPHESPPRYLHSPVPQYYPGMVVPQYPMMQFNQSATQPPLPSHPPPPLPPLPPPAIPTLQPPAVPPLPTPTVPPPAVPPMPPMPPPAVPPPTIPFHYNQELMATPQPAWNYNVLTLSYQPLPLALPDTSMPPPSLPSSSFLPPSLHLASMAPPSLPLASFPPPSLPLASFPTTSLPAFEPLSLPVSSLPTQKRQAEKSQSSRLADDEMPTPTRAVAKKKAKHKPNPSRGSFPKEWAREDALRAMALEQEYFKPKGTVLVLRFPDPRLDSDTVKKYSTDIASVFFPQSNAPRTCLVFLNVGADVERNIEEISKIPFGSGYITAERKHTSDNIPLPEDPADVNPYTLYISNLDNDISRAKLEAHFPPAPRIDIGVSVVKKSTRYATVCYGTVDEAFEAFKATVNKKIGRRWTGVRFLRRKKSKATDGATAEVDGPPVVDTESEVDVTPDSSFSCAEESETLEVIVETRDNVTEEAKRLQQQAQDAQNAKRTEKASQRRSLAEHDGGSSASEGLDLSANTEAVLNVARQPQETPPSAIFLQRPALDQLFTELNKGSSTSAGLRRNPIAGVPPKVDIRKVKSATENSSSDEEKLFKEMERRSSTPAGPNKNYEPEEKDITDELEYFNFSEDEDPPV